MLYRVVAAIMVQPGRILLGQRSSVRAFYPGVPDVFGAPIEPGEGQEQTLLRELPLVNRLFTSSWKTSPNARRGWNRVVERLR